ncbi:MAG: hypothetical protein ACTSUE_04660 [Promethearchaeota archaeon]
MAHLTEGYLCPNCGERGEHLHACQMNFKDVTMSLEKVKKLQYFCINCGRVAEESTNLCQPVALDEKDKDRFVKAALKPSGADTCKTCGQPVTPPGHICDPKGLPYTCNYCGAQVKNYRHVCKQMIELAKYTCKSCGRIAVEKEDVCAPMKLE